MKSQFDHNLISSFYLWFDNILTDKGEAVITGRSQVFKFANGINTPSNLNGFYSSERQFCADNLNAPNYIYLNSSQVYQNTTGSNKVIIDNNQGRILLDKSYGTGINISGNFIQKEINLYITNETEEEILLKNEFFVESGQSYSGYTNQIAKARYCLPCVFLVNNYSENNGFAIGGLRDTSSYIKAIIFAKSNYQLDGVLSLFRDSSEKCFKIIDQKDFPYGEYWHVKSGNYLYKDYTNLKKIDEAFIKEAEAYKLKENAQGILQKFRKDTFIGYIDFKISSIRSIL
jgi:hypothetical protein